MAERSLSSITTSFTSSNSKPKLSVNLRRHLRASSPDITQRYRLNIYSNHYFELFTAHTTVYYNKCYYKMLTLRMVLRYPPGS